MKLPDAPKAETPASNRITCIDALRGFDMLWIAGGDALVRALAKTTNLPWLHGMAAQMTHSGWTGFRFYDLIFPLFLFLSGSTIPLSYGRKRASGVSRGNLLLHAAIRMCVLIALGVIYNGGLQLKPLAETRVFSVLGLIGIAWFCATVLYLFAKWKPRLLWMAGILIFYWIALEFIPVPGHGAGIHTPDGSITSSIDQLMPWRLHTPKSDPEGLLQALAATFVAMAGCLAGEFLKTSIHKPIQQSGFLAIAGTAALGTGLLAGLAMEISKPMWNPPFLLTCTGCSLLLLALFHAVFDAAGLRKAAFPLVVVGMNPITIYLLLRIVPMEPVSRFFFGGIVHHTAESWQPVVAATGFILTWWCLLWFLYSKKWFLRV